LGGAPPKKTKEGCECRKGGRGDEVGRRASPMGGTGRDKTRGEKEKEKRPGREKAKTRQPGNAGQGNRQGSGRGPESWGGARGRKRKRASGRA